MLRSLLVCAMGVVLAFGLRAQSTAFDGARSLVDRVQSDLKQASHTDRSGKNMERYENAQKHLSEFDRELAKGKFDKDKLDDAINDVKNVVEHNTLTPGDRDALTRDLEDLRAMRARRGV